MNFRANPWKRSESTIPFLTMHPPYTPKKIFNSISSNVKESFDTLKQTHA